MASPADHASELSSFFNAHRGTPVSIEFHPPGGPLLISGPHIAIPKSHLLGAFRAALETFNALHPPPRAPWSAEDARALLDATLVLILVAAEHTTAVNARRRVLAMGRADVVTPRDEMKLLEGVLTSHLAKHNKSPSLWYYRRWIVETYGAGALDGLREELEVVRRSGEAHPRNYYAWSYARFIVDRFYRGDGPPPPPPPPPPPRPDNAVPPLQELVESHAVLCRTHVSDTSFWSFLLFLFCRARESPASGSSGRYIFSITKEAAIYAHDMARGHESVWTFLRTVMADETLLPDDAERQELVAMVQGWVQEGEAAGHEDAEELVLERKALRWIARRSAAPVAPLAAE